MFNLSDPSNDLCGLIAKPIMILLHLTTQILCGSQRLIIGEGASIEQFKLQVTNTISITQKYTEKCVPKNWITVKPSCPHHEVIHLLPRAPETDLGPGFRENCSRKNLESGSSSSIL